MFKMFKWLFKIFDSRPRCDFDKEKICPISFTWDRNGALHVDRKTFSCCKHQRQFEAAERLAKRLKLRDHE